MCRGTPADEYPPSTVIVAPNCKRASRSFTSPPPRHHPKCTLFPAAKWRERGAGAPE